MTTYIQSFMYLKRYALAGVFIGIWSLMTAHAESTLVPITKDTIAFTDTGGILKFQLQGLKRSQISTEIHPAKGRKGALVKVVIRSSKLRETYWIRKFQGPRGDPEIKGILVRAQKDGRVTEVRVRYQESVKFHSQAQIEIIESEAGVVVKMPRRFKSVESSEASKTSSQSSSSTTTKVGGTKSPNSPVQRPKVAPQIPSLTSSQRINSPTPKLKPSSNPPQALNEDQTYTGRPSVFERGTPKGPIPKLDSLRTSSASPHIKSDPLATQAVTSSGVPSSQAASQPPLSTPQASSLSALRGSNSTLTTSVQGTPGATPRPPLLSSSRGQKSSTEQSSLFDLDLDHVAQIVAYLIVLVLLLWGASFFLKRSKKAQDSELDHNQIKILSQQAINLNPRQRLLLVEARGHVFVVGACDRGGVSAVAHLETPQGVTGAHTSFSSTGRLDALSQLSDAHYPLSDEYYPDQHYTSEVAYHSSSAPRDASLHFEENTFVGEEKEEPFTAEVPQPLPPQSSFTGGRVDSLSVADSYADLNATSSPRSEARASNEVVEEDVQPEHLLQLIQNLNNSKS